MAKSAHVCRRRANRVCSLCYCNRVNLKHELPMSDTVENLVLDLLEWVHAKERTYHETMDAWRTSCPRLPVWEEANDRGLVETTSDHGLLLVRASEDGLAFLAKHRPQ